MSRTDRPLVSVVLPMRNAESHLESAYTLLRSLTTEHCDLEFVIVDDLSTDSTADIVATWQDRLPGRLVLLTGEGRGVAAARNLAISRCVGNYVWMADVDDSWEPNIVDRLVEAVLCAKSQIAICVAERTAADGRVTGRIDQLDTQSTLTGSEAFVHLLEGRISGHLWNKLFERELLGEKAFPTQRAHSDLSGMLDVFSRASAAVTLDAAMYRYVQNRDSILTSPTYNASDLNLCLAAAKRAVLGRGNQPAEKNSLLLFSYATVLLPQISFVAQQHATEASKREGQELRQRIQWIELVRLMSQARKVYLVASFKALVIKIAMGAFFRFRQARSTIQRIGR